jgi:hypothetical protein
VMPRNEPDRDIATSRLFLLVDHSKIANLEQSIRPLAAVSVRNEFDIETTGELITDKGPKPFVVRSRIRLPLGWETFEIYPPFDASVWNPNIAQLWAENDLLASTVQRNLRDKAFAAIDPQAEARKRAAKLIGGLENLLKGPEEPIHQYIKAHPELLCPTHTRCWSKLQFGKNFTDFVFMEPTGDYLLVELEKPAHNLFRNDGQPREELTHALNQITDWRRYLEDNLATVQRELGLTGISANPRSWVVMGRSESLTDGLRRKLATMENEKPRQKIMTYDDVLASAKATFENLLGPMWDPGPNSEVYYLPQQHS